MFSYTDDVLSIKMMCLLLLLVPDHKTKASTDLLVTFIPVSSLYVVEHSCSMIHFKPKQSRNASLHFIYVWTTALMLYHAVTYVA